MNVMRQIKLRKVILSAGAVDKDLEKAKMLLEKLSGENAHIIRAGSKRRIPAFNVKPNMELATRVTLRGEKAREVLKKLLSGLNNTLKSSQVAENHLAFGLKEYIDIPGMEYVREIGIRGLNTDVVFERAGVRVKNKKIKAGKLPKKQHIPSEEIISFMEENFKTKFT